MSYNSDQRPFGSSHTSSSSEYLRHGSPIALTTSIQEGEVLHITSKKAHSPSLCSIGQSSTASPIRRSSELELKPLRNSEDEIGNVDRQPQNPGKSGPARPFHKSGPLNSKLLKKLSSKKQSGNSSPERAPKYRVVGRGGSGSRLRHKSSSTYAFPSPNIPRPFSSLSTANAPRQPLESGFYRPIGRGGAGSTAKPRTPLKSPTAILGFLHRRRQSESQLTKQHKSQEVIPLVRRQSISPNASSKVLNDPSPVPNHSRNMSSSNDLRPRQSLEVGFHRPTGRGGAGSSAKLVVPLKPPTAILGLLHGGRKQSEGPSSTRSQPSTLLLNHHIPNGHFAIPNCFGPSSMLDEVSLSLSLASSTLEEPGPSISRNSDPNDNDEANSYTEEVIYPTPNKRHQHSKLIRTLCTLSPPQMDSHSGSLSKSPAIFNSKKTLKPLFRRASCTLMDDKFIPPRSPRHSLDSYTHTQDLHRLDLADDLDNASSVDDDTSHSPITFSPPSPSKITLNPVQITSPVSDINSTMTGEPSLAYSYSLTEPSLLRSPETPLYISNRSTSPPVSLPSPNSLPVKSNWLVPLETHKDEVVISIQRTKPQSWTGEWNGDIQDVIKNLRLL